MTDSPPATGRLAPLLLLFPLLLTGSACEKLPLSHIHRFMAFGTLIDLTLADLEEQRATEVARAIEQDFLDMHQRWHSWQKSALSEVNRELQGGEIFEPPADLLPMISLSMLLAEQSNQLFNPAIGKLIDAWGFHQDDPRDHRPPPSTTLQQLVQADPRMSDILQEGPLLWCGNPAVQLDLGAIGKGYGIGLAIERLHQFGVNNALLNAGGDLHAIGSRSGAPWRVAIRDPGGKGVLGTLTLGENESVFTSSNHERYFEYEGRRYHHLIDPRTGYPASGTSSVTVVHSDPATADAAATALFIAGPKGWFTIAQRMGLSHVLLVDEQGELHMNPGMQQRLELAMDVGKIQLSPPLQHP